MSRNVTMLAKRLGIQDGLFEQQKQLNSEADGTEQLANQALVGTSVIESSRSFYDFMVGERADKRAYVCNGTACECACNQTELKDKLVAAVGEEQVDEMTCLGHCYAGGAFMLDGQTYDFAELDHALNNQTDGQPLIPEGICHGQPILLNPCDDITDWYQPLLKAISENRTESLLEEIIASDLRGRGGAGFPTGVKWRACRDQQASEKYIICNADEGDPGAFSDRYLLERHPHSVIYGMLLAGVVTGAREGVLYLRLEYPKVIEVCNQAVADLKMAGILSKPLNDDGFQFDLHVVVGAGAYICGEETALLRSIEGQRPIVSVRPPFPVEEGLFGQPTIVNNVESFACVPWIIEHGSDAFKEAGTKRSAGHKLVCLDHTFNKPGLYEVPMGMAMSEVVNDLGGGFRIPVKALQIGGPLGGCVPVQKIADLTVSFESFTEHGFLLGHGSILGIPESYSMLDYVADLFKFTAHESCGKCFPCRLGATRGHEMMQQAQQGLAIDPELLTDLLDTMQHGSLCALGGGVPLPIRNILEYFPEEIYQGTLEVSNV